MNHDGGLECGRYLGMYDGRLEGSTDVETLMMNFVYIMVIVLWDILSKLTDLEVQSKVYAYVPF